MWTYNYNYSNELYHHGILGMKWGVRRYQNSDGSLTSAGKRRYNKDSKEKDESEEIKKKRGLTDKQKKVIKIGAIVCGAALATYGAYKIYQLYTGSNQKIDPETGFRLINKKLTEKQQLNAINPGRISFLNKTGKFKNKEIINGSSMNCMLCTTAYELRQRGYDVHAGLSTNGYQPDDLFNKIYKNYFSTKDVSPGKNAIESYNRIEKALLKEGSGSRGNIVVWWKGFGGGHSMIWENVNGSIKFLDGQTGQEYKNFSQEILQNISETRPIQLLRTDNLELNIPEIKKVINSDTVLKTYVNHGSEIAESMLEEPAVQNALIVSRYAALGAASYKINKSIQKQNKGGNRNDKSVKLKHSYRIS